MAKRRKRELTAAGVTRETLEQTPRRALDLIMGISTTLAARREMKARGYDTPEQKHGIALIEKCAQAVTDESATDGEITHAIAVVDAWDEPNFRIMRAALIRHPEVATQVFAGLAPATGFQSVVNVSTLLSRLDEQENTEEGRAALATLAKRGIDAAERKRIGGIVKIAKSGNLGAPDEAGTDDAYVQALLELRDWYDEWSEIARVVVRRRDHLIRLGLAERRTDPNASDVVDPVPFVDPTEDPPEPNDPNKPNR